MRQHHVDIPVEGGRYVKGTVFSPGGGLEAKQCVILCHGFTGDRHEWGRFETTASALVDSGFDVVSFDFTGSGENPREPVHLLRQARDLEHVAAWVATHEQPAIFTIGLSFGGITTLIANLPARKASAFWAPGFYMARIIGRSRMALARLLLTLRGGSFTREAAGGPIVLERSFFDDISAVDPDEHLGRFTTPALMIQGLADTAVKPWMTRRAFQRLPPSGKNQLVEVPGATHDFNNDQLARFIEATVSFFQANA